MLFLASLFTSYSNAQDLTPGQIYTTNNIVVNTQQGGPSTWTNGVYQNNLTCWRWGDPGYCGPNAIVRPDGNINFSFGQTDLYQTQAIASVLPATTGLKVNGYNFSFSAKNGNGWDNGRVDSLFAYAHITNQSNQVVSYNTYNLNYKFDWTTFNFSENFSTPFAASELKNVTYGFVGRDNNGWAGPYGPEINNVSFSLKYSVDPCQSDPLSSPTCPGYLAALTKMLPPPPAPEPVVTVAEPVQQAQQETVVAVVAPTPAAQPVATPTQPVQVQQQAAPQQAVAAANQQERSSGGPGLGFALNLISRNADRERAITQQASQQAMQEATSSGDRAVQQSANVAASSSLQSQDSSVQQLPGLVAITGPGTGTTVQQGMQLNLPGMQQQVQQMQQQQVQQQSTISRAPAVVVVETQQPILQLQQQSTSAQAQQVTVPQLTGNFLTDQISPIRSILESVPQPQVEQPAQTVRSNVQDSSLAGGVQISSLGGLPQGYQTYLQLQLQDARFYDSRPIYQNQRVVDNARALRGLGSDRLHQQLVQSQYK